MTNRTSSHEMERERKRISRENSERKERQVKRCYARPLEELRREKLRQLIERTESERRVLDHLHQN
jgi:hypothetical protein